MSKNDKKFSTIEELQFIDKLRAEQPQVYELYRQNFPLRTNWGTIDPKVIAMHIGLPWPPKQ